MGGVFSVAAESLKHEEATPAVQAALLDRKAHDSHQSSTSGVEAPDIVSASIVRTRFSNAEASALILRDQHRRFRLPEAESRACVLLCVKLLHCLFVCLLYCFTAHAKSA